MHLDLARGTHVCRRVARHTVGPIGAVENAAAGQCRTERQYALVTSIVSAEQQKLVGLGVREARILAHAEARHLKRLTDSATGEQVLVQCLRKEYCSVVAYALLIVDRNHVAHTLIGKHASVRLSALD